MISAHIRSLLEEQKTIIIPAFGALTLNDNGSIFYNEYIKFDDGKLAGRIAEKDKTDVESAKAKIVTLIGEIEKGLEKNGTFELKGFGFFNRNKVGKVTFETKAAVGTPPPKEAPKKAAPEKAAPAPKAAAIPPKEKAPATKKEATPAKASAPKKAAPKKETPAKEKPKPAAKKDTPVKKAVPKKETPKAGKGPEETAKAASLDALLGDAEKTPKKPAPKKAEPKSSAAKKVTPTKKTTTEKKAPTAVKAAPVAKVEAPKKTAAPKAAAKETPPPAPEKKPAAAAPPAPIVPPATPPKTKKTEAPMPKPVEAKPAATPQAVAAKASAPKAEVPAKTAAALGAADEEEGSKKKRKWIIWAIILLLLLGAAAFAFFKWDMVKGWFGMDDHPAPTEQVDGNPADENLLTPASDETPEADVAVPENEEDGAIGIDEDGLDDDTEETETPEVVETPVKEPQTKVNTTPTDNSLKYHVVAGSFSYKNNAENLTAVLQADGHAASILGKRKGLWVVAYSSFSSQEAAIEEMRKLKSAGKKGWVLTKSL